MGDSLVKTKYPKFITLYFHSILMLDHLPKNGLIPKGHSLPLPALLTRPDCQKYSFLNSDIEDVRLRIRDHIAIESKRKGRRQDLLTEDQYLELYFKAHSMDF